MMHFLVLTEGRSLVSDHIEDSVIASDGQEAPPVKEVAVLTKRSLRMEGEDGPTLKEVKTELVRISLMLIILRGLSS